MPIQPHLLWVLDSLCSQAGLLQTPGQEAPWPTKENSLPVWMRLVLQAAWSSGHLRSWVTSLRHQAYLLSVRPPAPHTSHWGLPKAQRGGSSGTGKVTYRHKVQGANQPSPTAPALATPCPL